MSFRDKPLTKGCDAIDVNGRRVVMPNSGRRQTAVDGDEITHWQPFQLKGGRVIPCRVATEFDAAVTPDPRYYMPVIGGIEMDSQDASLSGVGDVYLNVKFKLDDSADLTSDDIREWLVVDNSDPPYIGLTEESSGAITFIQRVTPAAFPSFDFEFVEFTQPWFSWKIGYIGSSPNLQSKRYFTGYESAFDGIDFSSPIYRKGTFFQDPNEWGVALISFLTFDVIKFREYPLPFEHELASGSLIGNGGLAVAELRNQSGSGSPIEFLALVSRSIIE